MRRFNWPLWLGLLLAVAGFFSYFAVFAQFPITRDVPWLSFLIFLAAIALLIAGWRRAPRKILATIVTALGLLVAAFFTFFVTVGTKNLPISPGAPAIGTKAPEFAALSQSLAGSNGVVLVFYRGFW